MLPQKLAFVDIETTGGSLRADRIIEIGVLRVENNRVVKTFNSLIDPQTFLPEYISKLTGISRNDLMSAPTLRGIKDEFLDTLDGCIMVAHSARFDYGFIKNELKNLGISFSPKHLCTVKLSKLLYKNYKHHNLDSIIKRYNLVCQHRHRAFDDAKVLWDFYQVIKNNTSQELLEKTISQLLSQKSIPLNIDKEKVARVPQKPGVYIFYGKNGLPLYIGKSINLKKRVMQHFSSDHASSLELKLSQQVENIESIVTSGELEALLKESELVKKMQPLYNRKLRHRQNMVKVMEGQTLQGYKTVTINSANTICPEEIPKILGVFKSHRQAKDSLILLVKEFQLCEKIMGIDKTSKACFGYDLGRCKGGCLKEEDPKLYNLRFEMAFLSNRISRWPFSGPVLIYDGNNFQEKSVGFIVDNWCVLGKIVSDGDIEDMVAEDDIKFNLDTYKILKTFIKLNSKSVVHFNSGIFDS